MSPDTESKTIFRLCVPTRNHPKAERCLKFHIEHILLPERAGFLTTCTFFIFTPLWLFLRNGLWCRGAGDSRNATKVLCPANFTRNPSCGSTRACRRLPISFPADKGAAATCPVIAPDQSKSSTQFKCHKGILDKRA